MSEWIQCGRNDLPEVGSIALVTLVQESDIYKLRIDGPTEVLIVAHDKTQAGIPVAVYMVEHNDRRYARSALGRCFKRKITKEELIKRRINDIYGKIDGTVSEDGIRILIDKGFILP